MALFSSYSEQTIGQGNMQFSYEEEEDFKKSRIIFMGEEEGSEGGDPTCQASLNESIKLNFLKNSF